jgi:chromate transporter
VLNLAVWFGLHVIYPAHGGGVDRFALLVTVIAFTGMLRWKWGILPVVLGAASAGLIFNALPH